MNCILMKFFNSFLIKILRYMILWKFFVVELYLNFFYRFEFFLNWVFLMLGLLFCLFFEIFIRFGDFFCDIINCSIFFEFFGCSYMIIDVFLILDLLII